MKSIGTATEEVSDIGVPSGSRAVTITILSTKPFPSTTPLLFTPFPSIAACVTVYVPS